MAASSKAEPSRVHLGMELDERGIPLLSPMQHNPCVKAKEASFKCLHENAFDNSKCEEFFSKYRECKKFWGQQKQYFREVSYKASRKDMFKW
eukprot:m.32422 g.32422  ORF g.32422 m.32422 type:complete len:92 (+) comp7048_c0_seq1:5519-5794(+)